MGASPARQPDVCCVSSMQTDGCGHVIVTHDPSGQGGSASHAAPQAVGEDPRNHPPARVLQGCTCTGQHVCLFVMMWSLCWEDAKLHICIRAKPHGQHGRGWDKQLMCGGMWGMGVDATSNTNVCRDLGGGRFLYADGGHRWVSELRKTLKWRVARGCVQGETNKCWHRS